jgi:uncharacterized protein
MSSTSNSEHPLQPLRITDAHCHVPSTEFVPGSFIDSTVDNVLASVGVDGDEARHRIEHLLERLLDDRDCDGLVRDMDAANITSAILIVPDFTFALRDCALSIEQMADRVRVIRKRHEGRFEAFLGVDPRWGADGVALFERALRDYGFRGLKVYPPCGFRPDDPRLHPYYELCASFEAPVMIHLGGTSHRLSFETARPIDVDRIARTFPSVRFILAHAGTTHPSESAMLAAFRPNVFLEVSGFQAHYSEPLSLLTDRGIGHKLIFGSDWPVFGLQATLLSTVTRLLAPEGPLAQMRSRDVDLFFAGTIERLVGGYSQYPEPSIGDPVQ